VAGDGARGAENAGANYGSNADGNTEARAEDAQQVSGSASRWIGIGVNTALPGSLLTGVAQILFRNRRLEREELTRVAKAGQIRVEQLQSERLPFQAGPTDMVQRGIRTLPT